MSQLRKLRRRLTWRCPPVALDLETLPLRGRADTVTLSDGRTVARCDVQLVAEAQKRLDTGARAGGLSAETIARHTGHTVESARELIAAYRRAQVPLTADRFDQIESRIAARRRFADEVLGEPFEPADVEVTIGGRTFRGSSIHDAIMFDEVGPSLPALREPWRVDFDLEPIDLDAVFAALDAAAFRARARGWFEREAFARENGLRADQLAEMTRVAVERRAGRPYNWMERQRAFLETLRAEYLEPEAES